MDPFLSKSILLTFGAILGVAAGALVGLKLAQVKGHAWVWAYCFFLGLILMVGATRWFPELESLPIFRLLIYQRVEFGLFGVLGGALLAMLITKVGQRRLQWLLSVFAVLMTLNYCILPFLSPLFSYNTQKNLRMRLDPEGVCLQGTDFNCGPAAGVTALRLLNLHTTEGELALKAYTSKAYGTLTDMLAEAIRRTFPQEVRVKLGYFKSVDDLRDLGPCIAVIKHSFLVDHYVVVTKVTSSHVTVADPLSGIATLAVDDFKKIWRKTAIILLPTTGLNQKTK